MTPQLQVKVLRAFYAIPLIAFGIQHFLFGSFITGRAFAWPASFPGQAPFAYAAGLLFIITGIAVLANFKPRLALTLSGIIILAWAGLRNIYGLMLNPEYGGLLTNLFKALTLGTSAFIVADSFSESDDASVRDPLIVRLAQVGRYTVALFLVVAGLQHFLFAEFVKFLIPAWIPGGLFWTYFSAVALIAAGLGIIIGVKARLAALCAAWMIFAWVFLLHLPRALAEQNQNEWTAIFEALAVSGVLFLVARSLEKTSLVSPQRASAV
jgi:uncharacterized membrane protein YphA (DoxX/SURF4 family)